MINKAKNIISALFSQAFSRVPFSVFLATVVLFPISARAVQSSGGVNWLDPLGYQKPQFVPIEVPDEASCPNKYYVDLSAGSNGSGTSSSPFNTFNSLGGKPGMSGGPAYVYVRGSGAFQRYLNSGIPDLRGSAGNEIVIKPWPGFTATLTYNYITTGTGTFQHIIWDGGQDMGFVFLAGSNSYEGAWNFKYEGGNDNLSHWTFYRTQWRCGTGSGQLFAALGRSLYMNFINNEFYDCNAGSNDFGHQFYLSGASNSGSWPNDCGSGNLCACIGYVFKNNIFRDNNNGLEINMRNSPAPYQIDGLVIEGNALHNIGKGLCGTNWACRPAITFSNTSNGEPKWRGVSVKNNIIWDTASGAIWTRAGNPEIYNNSITSWGAGQGSIFNQGIGGAGYPGPATVKNNLIYDGNKDPFDASPFTASNNLCASGKSCGSSGQIWSANTVLSIDNGSSNFLKIGSNSEALDHGTATGTTESYFGIARSGVIDIGADEYFSGASDTNAPAAPAGLVVN